jgi:hypothetical protein
MTLMILCKQDEGIGWPTLAGLGLVVAAMMVLSLLVTATGTARFMVPMGYDATIGYAVGALFDIAKSLLLVAVLVFWTRGSFGFAAIFGIIWTCLVTFSWLATHATVSTAIASIERTGSWKMEVRGNAKTELTSVEQQLAALSRPAPPRPAKTVRQALAAERVPASVWQDSLECAKIQESAHFARACAQVVQLRRELAASQDYERLSARAAELRKGLAETPILAISDPLPTAFSATIGRVLPLGGTEGVALLLTIVIEIMSCFGLAGLKRLHDTRHQRGHLGTPSQGSLGDPEHQAAEAKGSSPAVDRQSLRQRRAPTLPKPSLKAVASGRGNSRRHRNREAFSPPSNVVPMRPPSSSMIIAKGGSPGQQGGSAGGLSVVSSHVSAFVEKRLEHAPGASLAARDLRVAYEAWCATHGYQPLTVPKFATELKALGYDKWKSSGLMRYRDLQLVA